MFDLDSTLTNYNSFIERYTVPYFFRKAEAAYIEESCLKTDRYSSW